MHRTFLLNLLHNYQGYEEEQPYKKQIIHFIEENSLCFERSLEIGHITASGWLVNHDNSQVLLMHHAKLDMWVQLGGHCDGNSNVLEVAIKEAQEESGILAIEPISNQIFDIDVHLVPTHKNIPAHYHYDIRFLLRVTENVSIQQNHESKALAWFGKDKDKLPILEKSITRMFAKWITSEWI